MKHFISFTMLVFLAVGATGQTVHLLKPESSQLLGPIPPRIEKLESAEVIAPGDDLPIGTITSDVVTAIKVGEASNLFTFMIEENNQISAISASDGDAIAFIYRQNISNCGGSTINNGLLRYSISTDGGLTWDNGAAGLSSSGTTPAGCFGKGPINPAYLKAGRYPNFVLSLPDTGQSLQDLKGIYAGGALNPLYPSIDDWDGMVAGVVDLVADSIPVISQEDYYFGNNDQHLPYSLVERIPGEYWTATWTYDARTDLEIGKILKINRGVYDGMSGTVSWANVATINPGVVSFSPISNPNFVSQARQNPVIAFSPDGQTGYVSFIGDIDDRDFVYLPILIRSSDAGNTWEEPLEVKLREFDALIDTLQSFWSVVNTATGDTVPAGNGIPATGFSHDMVVDKWGNPHVVCIVGNSGSIEADGTQAPPNYTIWGDGEKFVCDITLDTFGDPNVILLHSQATFRGYLINGGLGGIDEKVDPWMQASRSLDGTKVFFSWTESDTTGNFGDPENSFPDFHTIGLALDSMKASMVTNHTKGDSVWSGKAYIPKIAPVALEPSSGIYILPTVVPEHSIYSSIYGRKSFWYFSDITYTDADFTKDISFFYNCKENPISVALELVLPDCDSMNGEINLVVSGGEGEYEYQWGNAGGGSTDSVVQNLSAGSYPVTVTDSAGCAVSSTILLNNLNSPELQLDSLADISCYGLQDGYAAVTAVPDSGASIASYFWTSGDTTAVIAGLPKGLNQLVVTDNLGCEAWLEIEVQEPDSLDMLLVGSNLKCYGDTDGIVLSYVDGGTAPYSYNWSNGDTVSSLVGVPAGMYSLMVTDGNGCQDTATTEVTQPDLLELSITIASNGICSDQATANYSGGTNPVVFTWKGPDGFIGGSNILLPLIEGFYTLSATDANGCTTTTDSVYLCNSFGMSDIAESILSFIISPNPSSGTFFLTLDLDHPQDLSIEIMTLQGQVVREFEEKQILHLDKKLNLSDQAAGIYFLQITTKHGTTSRKIILR